MDKVTIDVLDALDDARIAAHEATTNFIREHGDADACGFAWVDVKVRPNSKIGKIMLSHGFRRNSTRPGLTIWNPSQHFTQEITAKEKGADAYAEVLREKLGIDAYSQSRMD